MSESACVKKNLGDFQLSTKRIIERISGVGDMWKDRSYASLQKHMSELAKASKSVIEHGERTCKSIDKFFAIANEKV